MSIIWLLCYYHKMIIRWSSKDHLIIIWWSSFYLVIKDRCVNQMIIMWISNYHDHMMIIYLPSYQGLVCRSYDYHVIIIIDHLMITIWLSHEEYLMIIWWSSDDHLFIYLLRTGVSIICLLCVYHMMIIWWSS